MFKTIDWTDEGVVILDQTRLPAEVTYRTCRTAEEVAEAIRGMVIRGAPAIGVAAGVGHALGVRDRAGASVADLERRMGSLAEMVAAAAPTPPNLFLGVVGVGRGFRGEKAQGAGAAVGGAILRDA